MLYLVEAHPSIERLYSRLLDRRYGDRRPLRCLAKSAVGCGGRRSDLTGNECDQVASGGLRISGFGGGGSGARGFVCGQDFQGRKPRRLAD